MTINQSIKLKEAIEQALLNSGFSKAFASSISECLIQIVEGMEDAARKFK